jgi:hypothetical protein
MLTGLRRGGWGLGRERSGVTTLQLRPLPEVMVGMSSVPIRKDLGEFRTQEEDLLEQQTQSRITTRANEERRDLLKLAIQQRSKLQQVVERDRCLVLWQKASPAEASTTKAHNSFRHNGGAAVSCLGLVVRVCHLLR